MNEPADDLDDRPWERPGGVRRDCEPHRGPLLVVLGKASLYCGLLSLCLGFPALIGLPLGVLTLLIAWGDTQKMRAGLMDPAGRHPTAVARQASIGGITLGLIFWVLTLSFLWLILHVWMG